MTYWFAISNFHHCWRSVQTAFLHGWHCIIITLSTFKIQGTALASLLVGVAYPSHSYRDLTLRAQAGAPCLPAESSPPASCADTRVPMTVNSRKSASATLCCRTKEKPAFSASLWDRQSPQTLAAVVAASWCKVNASNRRRVVRWSSDIAHARGPATYATHCRGTAISSGANHMMRLTACPAAVGEA
jgi:hypothetical protein